MNITNNTGFALRKVHKFDLLNEELNERTLIDVLETVGEPKGDFVAIPHLVGYRTDESIVGFGDTVESALNECLEKISTLSWKELVEMTNLRP